MSPLVGPEPLLRRLVAGLAMPVAVFLLLAIALRAANLMAPGLPAAAETAGWLLATVGCAAWLWQRLRRLARAEARQRARLIETMAATRFDREGAAPPGDHDPRVPADWRELGDALAEAFGRAHQAISDERRSADAMESTNRTLAAEIESREHYLEKQTRRLQEAMSSAWQATEAKTRVLTNTSHEIRTPLNGIIGTTELLLRSQPLSDSQRGLLRTQLDAAEALLTLVDDILQFGQASSGMSLQPAPFDVAAEARLVSSALQSLADSRQIGLRVDVPRDFHGCRVGDRARIRQIMMGLVGNALKFTVQGEVVLELRDTEDLALVICVRDTGIGIPADQFSRIFEPFYQVESEVSRRFSGTGLGLAIINEVVRAMDGRITVESQLGAGSAFCVQIPLELADASLLAAPVEEAPAGHVIGDLRVLVVDDIAMNRELLELQVASLGATVATAESGMQALQLLERQEFDLLLLDCQMPELDGYETARRIRRRWPGRRLRIVAVTAHAQPGERERCLRCGMDDYISKPVAMSALERLLGATPIVDEATAP